MYRNKFVSLLAGAVMAAAPLAGASAAEVLKLAHFVPPAHIITKAVVDPLSNGLKDATNGELTIQVYPGGELGKGPVEQYVRALQGVADITWGLEGYTSSQFQKTMISELPGVVGEKPGYEMIWNAYDKYLKDEFPGTKPLALWVSEPNVFIMKDKEIRTPDDVKGLKIRVSGSAQGKVLEALGATPVQMPATEMYNALQTGLIDGIVTGSSAILDFKLNEVANSYTVGAPLGTVGFYLVMNQGRYDGLSDEFKKAVDDNSGFGLSKHAEETWNARGDDAIAAVKGDSNKTVVELSPEEAEAFGALTLPVTESIVKELGAEDVLAAMQGK
ncbi:TRAP transporter substrate-binding protein [Rhizobium sp. L1K21]|uniref:TRAP transporter substrate-binding protein n=1 Tax=Rhizobium sp. L1K21 TaxID=2954933 RepID=UPI0020926BED|nr:TRAP transporter substrate-binding protein [Rhizobium sp. L1K21]MCO6187245.1 TRAP transporter substrate-binding protein [Rhizobium sp. L1K21]